MKIKTAIKELFSDAETSTASKIEVISFLRRYASTIRPCTHYSCRGKSTDAIVRLLETMGMKAGKDFSVAASSLDPEFNQIRWTRDAIAVSKMAVQLSASTNLASGRVFDKMYVRVTSGKPVDDLVEEHFHDKIDSGDDGGEGGGKYVNCENDRHFSLAVLRRTKEIARAVMELHKIYIEAGGAASDMAKSMPPNFDIAITAAAEYLSRYFTEDGSLVSDASPYILPLSVLELFCRVVMPSRGLDEDCFAAGDPDKKPPLLFKVSPMAIDLVRLMRGEDSIVWEMCLNAPLEYLWGFGTDSEGDDNPLHGYFFRDAKSVLNATLDDKVGVFVGGNAAMIHEEGADNNVTVAACVQNHETFWTYVLKMYSKAYSCNAGMSCQSRVGVCPTADTWGATPPHSASAVSAHFNKWRTMHEAEFKHGYPLLAEYAVILSNYKIDGAFVDPKSFMKHNEHIKLVKATGESASPEFSKLYLSKEELAWEWFAMTHLDHTAGALGRDNSRYTATTRPAAEEGLVENLARFKAMMASADEAWMTKTSSCVHPGNQFRIEFDNYGRPKYTPLSAAFDGVCAVLKKTWQSVPSQATTHLPVIKKKTGTPRNSDVLVTNVYSGLVTNQSPALGSDEDTGDVFPAIVPATSGNLFSNAKGALVCHDSLATAVTKFLDRVNAGSMEQVCMAKRKAGTKRIGVMVFETNIDAVSFLNVADEHKLSTALGTVFLQTILLNRSTPACSINEDALRITSSVTDGKYSEYVHSLVRDRMHMLFEASDDWPTPPSGVYSSDDSWFRKHMGVLTLKDADGRMVIVFSVRGDLLTYARLMYRFGCGFPLDTAYVKEKLYLSGGGNIVSIGDGEWGDLKVADRIIGNYIRKFCDDVNGAYSSGAFNGGCGPLFRVPMEVVPAGRSPSRGWYVQDPSTSIQAGSVVHRLAEEDTTF